MRRASAAQQCSAFYLAKIWVGLPTRQLRQSYLGPISYFFILIHQIFTSKMHNSAATLLVLNVRFDGEKLSSRNLVFFCQFAEPFGKGYLFISWPPGLVSKDTRSSDKNLPR